MEKETTELLNELKSNKNLETYFRLGGKGATAKPTNFPISTADRILKLYNVNNNYYDYSCGWGVRMLSALRNNINYYGTDPNYLLTERLEELHNDYDKANGVNTFAKIYTQGSEVFIPELNKSVTLTQIYSICGGKLSNVNEII